MAAGGRTLEQIAELKAAAVKFVLAGESPEEAAKHLGVTSRTIRRALKEWRDRRGITARGLRELQIAARMARGEHREAG
ncbi:MAG: helix-turn-helix domain-containing protein [Candidatus Binatus sp.]|jgi:transposase